MVTVIHAIAAVSRPVAGYVLSTMQVVLLGALFYGKERATPLQHTLMNKLPKDVRTAMKMLHLVPDIVTYACCRKCFAIYEADESNPRDPFPRLCTHKHTSSSEPCNEPLVFEKTVAAVCPGGAKHSQWWPFRTYPYRSFRQWVAEFLLRPGIEKHVTNSWKAPKSPNKWSDTMEAPGVRSFLGPNNKTPFSVQVNGECHLIFSLFVDWFNPHGNKAAGKSHSIGAVYLACMNLPTHLRYRPENIYLAAIIPGPNEPNTDQLNHLIRPIVDELVVMWNPGLRLERTADMPGGRVVRVAVIPLVCDLPAVRKTSGFASYSAFHFCNFCQLLSTDMNNVDRETWPPAYSWVEHLEYAYAWRDAPNAAVRKTIFDDRGLRWSELLRLPYWDPTRYVLVDAMHNLFLGEFRHHCIRVWGFKTAEQRSKVSRSAPHSPSQQEEQLRRIRRGLGAMSAATIARARRDYLIAVAQFNGMAINPNSTKIELSKTMVEWVSCPSRSSS